MMMKKKKKNRVEETSEGQERDWDVVRLWKNGVSKVSTIYIGIIQAKCKKDEDTSEWASGRT